MPSSTGWTAAGPWPPPAWSGRPQARVPRFAWLAFSREGLTWLVRQRPLRALALAAALSNVGLGALFSVFVLFARVRLATGPLGYGLLLAAVAAGGLLGGLAAGRVTSAVGPGPALRVELAVEALTYLGLLLTRDPVAAAVLLAFLAVFSSVGAALRQSLAPPGMLGRVQSGCRAVSNSGLLAGAALGGLLTAAAGLTAPL